MSYAITDIIQWAKISQPLARFNGKKQRGENGGSPEVNLDIQIYNARKDLEYSYEQEPTSDTTFAIGQYVLSLIDVYLFQAQSTTGGGGSITPVTPGASPDPYDFEVASTASTNAPIKSGDTSVTLTRFIGYNILFIRGNITQSVVNQGAVYYSWNKNNGLFSLLGPAPSNGAAQLSELFQIYPVL